MWLLGDGERRAQWPLAAVGAFAVSPMLFEFVLDTFAKTEASPTAEVKDDEAKQLCPGDGEVTNPTRKAILRVDQALLRRPAVAWPTVLLGLTAVGGWCASMYLFCRRRLSTPAAFSLSTACAYVSFTPLHDAVHKSVSRYSSINDLVGSMCSVPMMLPLRMYRHLHLMHHRYANDDGHGPSGLSLDPDHWSGTGPVALLPLRWMFGHVFQVYWLKKDYAYRHAKAVEDGDRAALAKLRAMRNDTFAWITGLLASMAGLWRFGRDTAPVVCFLGPAVAAGVILQYFFGFIPHRPHMVSYKDDPYMSTSATRGLFGSVAELDVLMLSQNMHNIHHLFPQVPFYRYKSIWRAHQDELISQGTRVLPVVMLGDRAAYCKELLAKRET